MIVDSLGVVRPDCADDRARAPEVGRVKAARLLLAERHRLQRAPRLAELLAQSPEGDDPRDHAERSVVPAAGVLRVDVRAGRDDGTRLGSGEAAPDVPDRVVPRFQPCVLEPLGHLVLGIDPFRRVGHAPHPGLPVCPVPGQVEDVPLDERGIDVDGHGAILPPRSTVKGCFTVRVALGSP